MDGCGCCSKRIDCGGTALFVPVAPPIGSEDQEQEEQTERPTLSDLRQTPSDFVFKVMPEMPWRIGASLSRETDITLDTDLSLPAVVFGSQFGQVDITRLDVDQLAGWRLDAAFWHVELYVQEHRAKADDTPFQVQNPFFPPQPGQGIISWDVETLELGLSVPLASVGFRDIATVSLAIGGGYYRFTLKPSGGDFMIHMPPPQPPQQGTLQLDDETLSGFFGSLDLTVQVRVWSGLSARAAVREIVRFGDIQETQTQIEAGLEWSF